MTVGGGGGSPKTISRVIYTFGGGVQFDIYQCPIDTIAIIDPLICVNAAGNGGVVGVSGFTNFNMSVVSPNPVTGADMTELLQHIYNTVMGTAFFGNFVGAVTYSSISLGTLSTTMNFGRFEFSLSQIGANNVPAETFSKGLILYPGEKFRGNSSLGAGSKLVYALREYGISS